jgi:hypothetical protein
VVAVKSADSEDQLVPISRLRAWALMLWGPANSWDNPLCGTRYDPVLREHRDQARRDARRAYRAMKHHRGESVPTFADNVDWRD